MAHARWLEGKDGRAIHTAAGRGVGEDDDQVSLTGYQGWEAGGER